MDSVVILSKSLTMDSMVILSKNMTMNSVTVLSKSMTIFWVWWIIIDALLPEYGLLPNEYNLGDRLEGSMGLFSKASNSIIGTSTNRRIHFTKVLQRLSSSSDFASQNELSNAPRTMKFILWTFDVG